MYIAYVDDSEEDYLQSLPVLRKGFEENSIEVRQVDRFRNSDEFFYSWKPHKYDLLVLDILMDGLSGIEIAREVRKEDPDVCIVFCSSSNDFANESYAVDACYYLQKPLNQENTKLMFSRIKSRKVEEKRFITLPNGQHLLLRKMISASYYNHQMEITVENRDMIRLRISFSGFCELLKDYDYFCICNSGTCINLYQVKRSGKDYFEMNDGTNIQISRRKKNEVIEQYRDFLFRTLRDEV